MEKRSFVDQKPHAVWALLAAHPEVFRRQGTILVTWRHHQGRRLGPYYRLAYREGNEQRACYLGSSPQLAGQVRHALQALQEPRRRQRTWRVQWAKSRAALRRQKLQWAAELHKLGLSLKGYEIRGYRKRGGLRLLGEEAHLEGGGEHGSA